MLGNGRPANLHREALLAEDWWGFGGERAYCTSGGFNHPAGDASAPSAPSAPSLAPFYASPTYRGEAAGYGYIRTSESFAHTRLEIGWQGAAGYYRQTGTQGKKVPSRPSRFGLWEVGRKVAVPLALTLASPTSLSPLLLAFVVQLLGFGAQLARSPYVLRRDNRLAAASLFSVMCTLFFAGLLLSDAAGVDNGVETGKWLLLVLNVATLGALLGAVLLESLCESAAGQYLAARLWEALASRGLLGLVGLGSDAIHRCAHRVEPWTLAS